MALRDKLATRAQPYLEPGEQVQQVFCAYSGPSPYFAFLSSLIILFGGHYHIIVVTDRAVIVLDAGKLRSTFPKRLRIRGPRQVVMGDPRGLWGGIQLDQRYYVHRRFHTDVRAAQTG